MQCSVPHGDTQSSHTGRAHRNALQRCARRGHTSGDICNTLQRCERHGDTSRYRLRHDAMHSTRCNALRHDAIHCDTMQYTATRCNALRHDATHCNAARATATLDTSHDRLRHDAMHFDTTHTDCYTGTRSDCDCISDEPAVEHDAGAQCVALCCSVWRESLDLNAVA